VDPANRKYQSIAVRRSAAGAPQHGEQQQMRAVSRCQLTQEAEHRLAICGTDNIYVRYSAKTIHKVSHKTKPQRSIANIFKCLNQ